MQNAPVRVTAVMAQSCPSPSMLKTTSPLGKSGSSRWAAAPFYARCSAGVCGASAGMAQLTAIPTTNRWRPGVRRVAVVQGPGRGRSEVRVTEVRVPATTYLGGIS